MGILVLATLASIGIITRSVLEEWTEKANDKAAQSGLRNALVFARADFTDTNDYSSMKAAMNETEGFALVDGANSTGPSEVSFAMTATDSRADTVLLTALSKGDNCFGLKQVGTGESAFYVADDVQGACAAKDAAGATGTSW